MKYRIFLTSALLLFLLLTIGISVSADETGYVVSFTEGYVPTGDFQAVCQELNLYTTKSLSDIEKNSDHVRYYEKDLEAQLIFPDDKGFSASLYSYETELHWDIEMTGAPYAWENGYTGSGVRVGIIDTGCNILHDELKDNIEAVYNFTSTDTEDVTDNIGHGTHIAGTVAAIRNGKGVVGMAPDAKIVVLKGFENGFSSTVSVLAPIIIYAADKCDCDIINMSWGFKGDSETLRDAIDFAYSKGVILVASAGNEGGTAYSYPAAYSKVIAVASVDKNKAHAETSRVNDAVDVSAPGQSIYSTSNSGSYVTKSGTSMASPHIVGAAALAKSIKNTLTPDEFRSLIAETSEDIGDVGYDSVFGCGLINMREMTDKLLSRLYVSDIRNISGKDGVVIKNYTGKDFSAYSFLSAYDQYGRMRDVCAEKTDIPDGKSVFLSVNQNSLNSFYSLMLWKDIRSLIPLCEKRVLEKNK